MSERGISKARGARLRTPGHPQFYPLGHRRLSVAAALRELELERQREIDLCDRDQDPEVALSGER